MQNGEIHRFKCDAVRKALRKTRGVNSRYVRKSTLNWSAASKLVGLSETGLMKFAVRNRLVKKDAGRRWVLA